MKRVHFHTIAETVISSETKKRLHILCNQHCPDRPLDIWHFHHWSANPFKLYIQGILEEYQLSHWLSQHWLQCDASLITKQLKTNLDGG